MTASPRKPWIHPNRSNTSLRGMEIAVPPGHALPPPEGISIYQSKPLPPVPARQSMSSSFSSELNSAFRTPKRSMDYPDRDLDWKREEANIDVILARDAHDTLRPYLPKIHIAPASYPSTPPDELLSPQPRKAVPKILRLTAGTGAGLIASPTSPSGHNPSQKIRQLMGVDVGSGPSDSSLYEVSPVSPLSASSSVYSEDLAATISEPDTDLA